MRFFIEEGKTPPTEYTLHEAAKGGHRDVLDYLIDERGADGFDYALFGAAIGGDLGTVKYLEEKGATDFELALAGAAQCGHRELVKYFIKEKGARDFEQALQRAAFGGQIEMVLYFLRKGAHDLEQALAQATVGGQLAMVKFFVEEKGVNDRASLLLALEDAELSRSRDVIQYLRSLLNL